MIGYMMLTLTSAAALGYFAKQAITSALDLVDPSWREKP